MITIVFFTLILISSLGFLSIAAFLFFLARKGYKSKEYPSFDDVIEVVLKSSGLVFLAVWLIFLFLYIGQDASLVVTIMALLLGSYWLFLVTKDFIGTIRSVLGER
jgi:hypothetical protein